MLARISALPVAVAAAMAIGIMAGGPANAQQSGNQAPPSNETMGVDEIGSDTLQSYAAAKEEIITIGGTYGERIDQADSNEEVQRLREEAQTKFIAVIRDEGLSVNDYNRIAQAERRDPELAAAVQSHMEAR